MNSNNHYSKGGLNTMKIIWSNVDNLVSVLKIHADKEYKNLIEKAVSLEIEDFNYSIYDPQGLRYRIGEKLHEIATKENQQLRQDFYNINSRGC